MSVFLDSAAFQAATPFFSIEAETPALVPEREALLDAALGPGRRRKSSEAIRRRRLPAEGLSFVAIAGDGALIGTVRLWNVAAGDAGTDPAALLLGPLAVDPAVRGAGVGAALMRRTVSEAAGRGHDAIILVGDPDYYGRFGFDACPAAALTMPGPFERHRLLALELCRNALTGARGRIRPTGAPDPLAGGARVGRPRPAQARADQTAGAWREFVSC